MSDDKRTVTSVQVEVLETAHDADGCHMLLCLSVHLEGLAIPFTRWVSVGDRLSMTPKQPGDGQALPRKWVH